MDNKQARYLHRMLDRLAEGKTLKPQEIQSLRKSLPEPPAQKTLEEITEHVREAWVRSSGNIWTVDISDPDATVEGWLRELYAQLKGVEDESAPALPAGMRIAEHENFGRVVVSPGVGIDGCYEIFNLDPGMSSGTDISEVEPDSLTFIDIEPAHPEFLETEADYQNAPNGTVVGKDGWLVWLKQKNERWACDGGHEEGSTLAQSGRRRILRWGWGK